MGFFEILALLIVLGIPSTAWVLVKRAEERRIERTNPDRLAHDYFVRRLEIEHAERMLALPMPVDEQSKS